MSLLNDASLVLIPSGYKEDKVYSIIPSDGSGDLDFVRGSDGTRINSLGQVENVCWNLVKYSEDFTNGAWQPVSTTLTSNDKVSPIGTTTADKFVGTVNASSPTVSNGSKVYYVAGTNPTIFASNNTVTCSAYVYAASAIDVQLFLYEWGGAESGQSFTLVPNTWQRITYTKTFSGGTGYVGMAIQCNANTIWAWGAQLNVGSTAKPYFPTTDRLNVPRLTYENGCPSLLLEKQSINISQFAEVGTGGFLAATVTNGTELLGLKTFKILTDNTAYGDSPYINTNIEYQANTAYTLSFYTDFSKSNGTTLSASMLGFFPGVAYAGITINKSTKSITTFNVGGIWTINSYTANQISGEIYRIVVTCTPNATSAGGSRNYINADNTFYAEVCGVQTEASAYPTSYIYKPASTSVTRLADSCSKTGISSLIGQTSGAMFCEFNYYDNISGSMELVPMYIGAGAYSDGIYFDIYQDVLYLAIWVSASQQTLINCGALNAGKHKVAVSYTANDINVYLDGALIGSDNSASIPSMSQLNIGTAGASTTVERYTFNQGLLFKRVLTSQEAIALTTL